MAVQQAAHGRQALLEIGPMLVEAVDIVGVLRDEVAAIAVLLTGQVELRLIEGDEDFPTLFDLQAGMIELTQVDQHGAAHTGDGQRDAGEAERQFAGDLQIVEKHGSPRAQVTGRGCEVGFR
jgi:hypothetical protein